MGFPAPPFAAIATAATPTPAAKPVKAKSVPKLAPASKPALKAKPKSHHAAKNGKAVVHKAAPEPKAEPKAESPYLYPLTTMDWHTVPVEDGVRALADLQRLWEHASKVMQQRQQALAIVACYCGCKRRLYPAQATMSMALRDPSTLLPYNVYFATQECVRQHNRKKMGLAPGVEALPR